MEGSGIPEPQFLNLLLRIPPVTRVQSVGKIKVKFEVMKRNFSKFGYN